MIAGFLLLAFGLLQACEIFTLDPEKKPETKMMPWPVSFMLMVPFLVIGTAIVTWGFAHHWPILSGD